MKRIVTIKEKEQRDEGKISTKFSLTRRLKTGLILFVVSLASIASYIFLKNSKNKSRQDQLNFSRPSNPVQAEKTGIVDGTETERYRVVLKSHKPRLWLILGALGFGVAGQLMLQTEKLLLLGALFVFLSALFIVVLFRNQSGPGDWLITQPLGRQLLNLNWWGVVTLGLAILFSGLAFWLFGEELPAYYPWLLHRVSIGLLIVSSFWLNKPSGRLDNPENKKRWTWLEGGIFIIIMAIAAFMRLYRFDQIPFGLWYDEADNGLVALNILNSPDYLPVFATTLPAHFFYLIAMSFKILGVSTLAIRAVSVVFGMATIVVSFFLGNELFNRKMGLVLAFFLAVSRWDVNWSRIGMHGISVPFFEILSAVLILRAVRKQNLFDYVLAGLSLGLGLCFYTPLFFFPVVIVVFLLFLWLKRHDLVSSSWRGFLLLALGFVVASVPISQFALRQPESFSGRVNVTSIFTGKTRQEGWEAVARTSREHLLMFNYHGDNNGRHNLPGEPMLDPISGAFMVMGVALSLWRIRQPGSFLLITWLLVMLVPGIFSLDFESPQSLRAIGSMPAAYLLCVVPIHALWQERERFSDRRLLTVYVLPIFLALGAAGYINYHIYFNLQSKRFDSWFVFSTPETIVGEAMAELGPQVDVYISNLFSSFPTMQFLAQETKEYHVLQTDASLPFPSGNGKAMAIFVDRDRKPFFLQAQRYYSNADFKEYKAPDGSPALYQIILEPSDIEAAQGITVSYYRNANWMEPPFLVTTEKTINMNWKDGDPGKFPFGAKWQGVLFVEHFGVYRLMLHSPSPSELYLDNVQIPLAHELEGTQTFEIELAKGSHDLLLKTVGKEGHFELDWQPPGEEQTRVPSANLFLPPISNNGLLGTYYENDNWLGAPVFTRIDPWIHFFYQERPLPVEWVGRIKISKAGVYRFGLESADESELFIDDQIISSGYKEGEIYLSAGFHLLRLRYAANAEYSQINLYWTPPGAEREIVPQEALFLP